MTDKLQHHELTAEWVSDSQGPGIMLTQLSTGYCEPETVMLHPWQLRAVCEQFGLIANNDQSEKTIATLTRRLHLLRERVAHLAHWLANHSDTQHADLSYEQTYATADIADEFCIELDNVQACTDAPKHAPERVNLAIGVETCQLSIEA